MKHTGDRPGKGTYICMTCGKKIVIEKDEDKLPVLPPMQRLYVPLNEIYGH